MPSGFDTTVRGGVMLAVLGGGIWGAMQYPPVADRARQLLAQWENGTLLDTSNDDLAQKRLEGGDAPPFQAGSPAEPGMLPARSGIDVTVQPLAPPPGQGPYPAQQVDFQREAEPSTPAATAENSKVSGTRPVDAGVPAGAGVSPLLEFESLLRELGATYCLLERWQDHPPRYRFHCRVQLSAGSEPRRFEASGPDPAGVMRQVAQSVAAAREGSAPLGQLRSQSTGQ